MFLYLTIDLALYFGHFGCSWFQVLTLMLVCWGLRYGFGSPFALGVTPSVSRFCIVI